MNQGNEVRKDQRNQNWAQNPIVALVGEEPWCAVRREQKEAKNRGRYSGGGLGGGQEVRGKDPRVSCS